MFTNSWTTIFATIVCKLNSWGRTSGLFITWSSSTGVDRCPLYPQGMMDLPESQDIFTDFWKLANGATEHEARGVPSVAVPSEKTYEALTKPCFRSNWSPGTLLQLLVLRLGWL